MANFTITHTCGHTVDHQLFGPVKERDQKAAYLESCECSECYKRTQTERAQKSAAAAGLPQLEGTEKQVAWAETIRAKKAQQLAGKKEELAEIPAESDRPSHVLRRERLQEDIAELEKLMRSTRATDFINAR